MLEYNGMQAEIKKSWYNKSVVQPDGITHIIDTDHKYTVYQFGVAKNYFDIEDRAEVVRLIAHDLRDMARHLEELSKEKDDDLEIE